MTTRFPLAALLAVCMASTLAAQERLPSDGSSGAATRSIAVAAVAGVTNPPVIDGRLDDAAWGRAALMTGFTQREPQDGQPASEPTEVRVVFDDEALYVGVWAFDSRPGEIVPGERIRDYEVSASDNVILILDTYKDEQNGFVFGTTPAGIEYDGQVANEGRGGGRFGSGGGGGGRGGGGQRRFQSGAGGGFNKNWDGSWTVATLSRRRGVVRRVPHSLQHPALRDGQPVLGFQRIPPDPTAERRVLLVPSSPGVQSLPLELRRRPRGTHAPLPAAGHRDAVRSDLDSAELRGG